jgi:UDP-GlcNAc:undecaprenyl-phosphate GlcNAc-1-phosphate transferase
MFIISFLSMLAMYFISFLISFSFCLVFTKIIILLSKKYKLFDEVGERKIHQGEISRLGGVGIVLAFYATIFLSGSLVFDELKIGIVVCSALILIFGVWDDIRNISWKKQIAFQILLALVMIYFGLHVDYIANPFGGNEFRLDTIYFLGFSVIGSIFLVLWIVSFVNIVNWLDGMDGMASGVGAIAAFTLFFLSISDLVNQPPLAIMAISLVGALLGFLVYNFHPAKIFMGSSGAWFLGFMLAVLAIFAGGKIATVFLVMGIPIFDALWVVTKRIKEGRPIFKGDKSHFYHNFLEAGWGQRKVALFTYLVCSICGLLALAFQGFGKFMALMILFLLVLGLALNFKFRER